MVAPLATACADTHVSTSGGLLARPLPVAMPAVPVDLARHGRHDGDPAHAWLRAQVRAAVAGLFP